MTVDPSNPDKEQEESLEIQYRNWVIIVLLTGCISVTLGIMMHSIIGMALFGAMFVGSMIGMCRCGLKLDELYDRVHYIRVEHYRSVKRNKRGNNPTTKRSE